ncbi:MAG: hypothetical protein WBN65_12710 [Gammaproteobacteria bacterium]
MNQDKTRRLAASADDARKTRPLPRRLRFLLQQRRRARAGSARRLNARA